MNRTTVCPTLPGNSPRCGRISRRTGSVRRCRWRRGDAAGLPAYTILDGHWRVQALWELGRTEVLVIVRHDLVGLDANALEAEFLRCKLNRRRARDLVMDFTVKKFCESGRQKRARPRSPCRTATPGADQEVSRRVSGVERRWRRTAWTAAVASRGSTRTQSASAAQRHLGVPGRRPACQRPPAARVNGAAGVKRDRRVCEVSPTGRR